MIKSDLKEDDVTRCILAFITENGVDTGICGEISGKLIGELEDVIEKIKEYQIGRDYVEKIR